MPKPVLQAMVLADHVYQDRVSGKFIIAGTFSTILFGQTKTVADHDSPSNKQLVTGPIGRAGTPFLYIALVEVHDQISLDLKYVDLADASVLIEARIDLTSGDPVAVAEFIVTMPELPSQKIGNYSLDLLYDGEILGSWRVAVREIDSPGVK